MGLYNTPQPGLPGLFGGGGQVPGMAPQAPGMPQMPAQMPQQGGAMSLPYLAMLAALLQRMGAGGASPFGMGGGAMPGAQPAQPGMPMAPRPMFPPQVR